MSKILRRRTYDIETAPTKEKLKSKLSKENADKEINLFNEILNDNYEILKNSNVKGTDVTAACVRAANRINLAKAATLLQVR